MKITQKSIRVLERNWKKGTISRFDFPIDSAKELKKLGIIKYHERKCHYVIYREVYNKIMNIKQKKLIKYLPDDNY